MESGEYLDERKAVMEEPLLEDNDRKGGFRALPFIIGSEGVEKMATYGLMQNMALYLMSEYHMEMSSASTLLFLWSATSNFMPLLGAILADSFLGRFYTIGFGSIICLMGMILLWSTTVIPSAKPPPCSDGIACTAPTVLQLTYLCTCFGLMSIGAGGIRSSCLAFGADQLEKGTGGFAKHGVKECYFGWYYASYTFSVLIALTCIVYIQDNLGWSIGFAVPAVLMFFNATSFFFASSFYVKMETKKNLVTGLFQVAVASYRNRHLRLSESTDYLCHCEPGSTLLRPSQKLGFLNMACIVKDPESELTVDGEATNPWSLCTVDQVEGLKALLRVLPIWSAGMFMAVNISQNTIPLLQAVSMDRRLGSFTIPAASFTVFMVISVILWITLYDRVFLPIASNLKGRSFRISSMTRMGVGIFLSCLSMIVAAAVEGLRRRRATTTGSHISALWLVPQNCLSGFAEASNAIAQNEFYFSELPRSMSSIAATLTGIGLAVANIVASLIMNAVDALSRAGGGDEDSWVSSDIDKGHYDYYYLVLAGLAAANMIYYLICSRGYSSLH
ncbi:protein NRT1/ PTR FAMILY 1.1-like [Andrographis paniculata]|uniref:protein NRT1/ PTR FAMILY 1.1-like n=1 Tax=Andrographis paniculata TaxID=175694 RepID=UPI0021E973EF|nr:protein NRT1/ PTR FAMILY 1.1-like [Andrographis paniculata]